MRKRKRVIKIFFTVIVAMLILLLIIYINHQIHLKGENELRLPLGKMVEVDGHNMSVYIEGTGDTTLVFMSGGGTCSPILDFKSLYSLLSDKYQIAVVEKFGYGFSDVVDKNRDIDSILEDTRAALTSAGLTAPYILCPHSMSGLEALYWAQKYPDEVSAIIGLDMAVPEYYGSMNINIPLMRIASWAANIGATRFIPGLSDSDAVKYGTLSEKEKEIYKAVFYSRTATVTMINETEWVKENAETVHNMGTPQLPMLLFISDGSGGTGFDKETWREIPIEYISQIDEGEYIELNCPHYVHDYEYKAISESIIEFYRNINFPFIGQTRRESMELFIQERLKDLRVERGLTLEQLAEQTHLSKSALGSYEGDKFKDISHYALIELAKFYEVTVDYLLGRSQTKNHPNADLADLRLSDAMIELLKSGLVDNSLLCELATHPDFPRLMADLEIYVNGVAGKQVQGANAIVDAVSATIMKQHNPGLTDPQ